MLIEEFAAQQFRRVVGNLAQPLFQFLLAFQSLAWQAAAVGAGGGLAVFRARIIAVGRFAVRGQAAGNRRAAAGGTRVLARGLITGAIGRLLGAGATLCRTIARAAVLTAILVSALVAVRCFVCVALLLLLLLFTELLQKVLQRIAVMPCTLVCRVQGQGMFIGFQCSGIVTGHGQSGAAIEKIFRVVRLYMAERCPLLGGGSMLTGLIERPGTPFGIAEALRGGRRLLVPQQLHGLLIRPLPEVVPTEGEGVLRQQQSAQQQPQPTPAGAQGGNRKQQQDQPVAVVDQQDAVTGGCGARALQWPQKIVQVTIAGGDLVIARAMLAGQITQLLAVQSRQQDAALVVAQKATLAQRDRGA